MEIFIYLTACLNKYKLNRNWVIFLFHFITNMSAVL